MEVLIFPNPLLTIRCREVSADELETLAPTLEELEKTLADRDDGIGLAATQVGLDIQAFAWKRFLEDGRAETTCCLNPKIIHNSGQLKSLNEGCLSLPGVSGKILRYPTVTMKWMDRLGNENVTDLQGLHAQIAQHEIQHLQGHLLIDGMGFTQRKRMLRGFWRGQNETSKICG
jgi:peptide deformylase